MGLTAHSVGIKAVDSGLVIKKQTQEDKVVALAWGKARYLTL